MILHLKRFDLDFQTFETVKLNNMFEYTKEGIEQLERKKLAEAGGGGVEGEDDDEMSMVPTDAWSTKQAGVAQGEHYYSFVRSDSDDIDETAAHLVDGMQA